ncbi:WS/DGAT domain-containing protein [Actinoplanes sp. NPDC049265]|uniref:WS/DGAT domain-containing protein n=1 Tax=Actinoplanes sp. NPDC049265 TaxID=3363902 RepID=UPI00371EDB80
MGGDRGTRIQRVTEQVRRRHPGPGVRPPVALFGGLFRAAAALGFYRWYMSRQHRVHTVVSYVAGPVETMRLGGRAVRSIIPVGVSETGNITVAFQAFSYRDTVIVSAVADPDACPELDDLMRVLRDELAATEAMSRAELRGGRAVAGAGGWSPVATDPQGTEHS